MEPPLPLHARDVAAEVVVLVELPPARTLARSRRHLTAEREVGDLAHTAVRTCQEERHNLADPRQIRTKSARKSLTGSVRGRDELSERLTGRRPPPPRTNRTRRGSAGRSATPPGAPTGRRAPARRRARPPRPRRRAPSPSRAARPPRGRAPGGGTSSPRPAWPRARAPAGCRPRCRSRAAGAAPAAPRAARRARPASTPTTPGPTGAPPSARRRPGAARACRRARR